MIIMGCLSRSRQWSSKNEKSVISTRISIVIIGRFKINIRDKNFREFLKKWDAIELINRLF
jgi:hypothetical protein